MTPQDHHKNVEHEERILEPLKDIVREGGNFALLLEYPDRLVKFHSSDSYESYMDLFTNRGNLGTNTSSSPPESTDGKESKRNIYDTQKQAPINPDSFKRTNTSAYEDRHETRQKGVAQLSRALESPTLSLSLSSKSELQNHLRTCFRELQQVTCKIIAKAWIRVIEPKKQTRYPYNKGESTKPPWWPEDIRHCEPDHLVKGERIDLLVAIVRDPIISIKDLRAATNRLASLNEYKLSVLDEVYLVAKTANRGRSSVLLVSDFENGVRSRAKTFLKQEADLKFDLSSVTRVDEEDKTSSPSSSNESDQGDGTQSTGSIAPTQISITPPAPYHNNGFFSEPSRGSLIFNRTPEIKQDMDLSFDSHFHSYNLGMSPSRIDPQMLDHMAPQNHHSHLHQGLIEESAHENLHSMETNEHLDEFDTNEQIVSEVLKIKDFNMRHDALQKQGAFKGERDEDGAPNKRAKIEKLGPPLFLMKTNDRDYFSKVPVYKN